MTAERNNPPGLHTPPRQYSHLARSPAGEDLVFVAGQVALDEAGNLVGGSDIELQGEQALRNVGVALNAAGADWADVLRLTTYLTSPSQIDGFARCRKRLFAGFFPDGDPPTSVLMVVAGLARPEYLVEVDAVASIR